MSVAVAVVARHDPVADRDVGADVADAQGWGVAVAKHFQHSRVGLGGDEQPLLDQAIEGYEACLAHIDRHPDGFDSDSRAWYRDQIERLRRQSKRARSS